MRPGLFDDRETRAASRRLEYKRFLDGREFNVHQLRRAGRQKIDRPRGAVIVVRLYLRTGLRFKVGQIREMRVNECSAAVFIIRVEMEHRPIDHREEQ